jgi:hypothetical protein
MRTVNANTGRRVAGFPALALLIACVGNAGAQPASSEKKVTRFPEKIDRACREGDAELYDECGEQKALFRAALNEANRSGKTLIVSFGAEWCIWCHVFDAHLAGATGRYTYRAYDDRVSMDERGGKDVRADAARLNEFASRNLVVVHIEADHAPGGVEVLRAVGVDVSKIKGLPYIFSITSSGKLAVVFDNEKSEVRRDIPWDLYRGYDRKSLLQQLSQMHAAARAGR